MSKETYVKGAESVSRFEVKRYGYTLIFEISPDEMECSCSYEPSTVGGTPLTESELQSHLAQYKIREGIVQEAVFSLLDTAASAKSVSGLQLACGSVMVPGEDEHVVLGVSDSNEVDETDDGIAGNVDFRHVQSFLNVEVGDLVATVIPPGSGNPGMTVTGKTIPPQPGAPLKLEVGQGVRLDDCRLFATAAGRVYLRGHAVSVEDIYEVDGNVDFKVGNITFNGFVEVKGDVLDGFFVKATKGIKVKGNVGVCDIESFGDITFSGMNGQGVGKIVCGGSIYANFICDTQIECAGDINAEIEIRSSNVKCLGAIMVSKGGVTGGEYFALAGVECATLGSRTSLRTRVVAGVHYGDLEELSGLFNELKLLVAGFSAAPKGTVDMKEFAKKRAEITERTQEVRSRVYAQCNPKINVKKVLYEGVSITLGLISDNVAEEHKGPVSVIENSIAGGFRFLGMTPLSFKAQMIEERFVKIEQQNNR